MNSYVNEYLAAARVLRMKEAARRASGEQRPSYGRRRRERLVRAASLVR
jgi:hypothetical protein